MNTRISYMYRDASNYKAHHSEVFSGEITPEQETLIRDNLNEIGDFIPEQVGLPALQENMIGFPSEDDHCWHELVDIELTNTQSAMDLTIAEFAERFRNIVWDDITYAICVFDEDEED